MEMITAERGLLNRLKIRGIRVFSINRGAHR
jgi:hypothetical protein